MTECANVFSGFVVVFVVLQSFDDYCKVCVEAYVCISPLGLGIRNLSFCYFTVVVQVHWHAEVLNSPPIYTPVFPVP